MFLGLLRDNFISVRKIKKRLACAIPSLGKVQEGVK